MDADILELRKDFIALRAVTVSLWANFLANGADDPSATARHLSREMVLDLGRGMPDSTAERSANLSETIHEIQDRLERFWESVEELLDRRESES